MRTRNAILLVAVVMVLTSCGDSSGPEPPVATAPTTVVTSTPSAPATVKTTIPTLPTSSVGGLDAGPPYYRSGSDGLYRVVGGVEERLSDRPVAGVWDDYLGGVIFMTEGGAVHWLQAGDASPTALADLDSDNDGFASARPQFTGMIDGQPHVFYSWSGSIERASAEDRVLRCDEVQLIGRSLVINAVTGYMCLPLEDAWLDIRSVGGGRFVGVLDIAAGASGTSRNLLFWDLAGEGVELDHNPFRVSCEPCELSAIVSPDGSVVAYRFRPDSKWPPQQWDDVPWEDWWEQTKGVTAELVVLDLNTGLETWRRDGVAAETALVDFDGRYLVTASAGGKPTSSLYDTWAEGPPLAVPGTVTLVRGGAAPTASASPDLGVWTTEVIQYPVMPPCCAVPAVGPISPPGEIPESGSIADGFYDVRPARPHAPDRLEMDVRRWVSCDDLPDQCVSDWPPGSVTPDDASVVSRSLELTNDLTVVIWPVWDAPGDQLTALVGTGDAFARLLSGIDRAFLDWVLIPHRRGASDQEIVAALLNPGGDPNIPFAGLPGFSGSPAYRHPLGAYLTPHLLSLLDSSEPWPPGRNGLYDWWTTLEVRDGRTILYVYANQVAG